MDINLDSLKREILDHLETSGTAVFRSTPGGLEGMPIILWDAEKFPDYRQFLDVAHAVGARMILFASAEFESDDLDSLAAQLDEIEIPRDERRSFEARIRALRIHVGVTCTLELAFDMDGRMYVYDVQPDWYDEFLDLEEEITANMIDEDDFAGGDDSLGGYFSKN